MIAAKATYTGLSALSLAAGVVAPAAHSPRFIDSLMAAVGIQISGPVFLAGLAFAVAGAFIALARTPPEDRASKWWTLATAVTIGTAAAIIQGWAGDTLHRSISTLPPQVFMFISGMASRQLADWLRFSDPVKAVSRVADAALSLVGGKK